MASGTFQVEIKGLDKLTRAFDRAPQLSEPILQQAIAKSAAILASHTEPPNIPWRTGTMARSFNPATIGRLFARWYPRVDYAPHVQFGTKPHIIEPKNGKALYWKGAAHPVKRVNHPGSRPKKFMEKILSVSVSEINELFKNAGDAIVSAIGKS